MHGEDDQIVAYADSAPLAVRLLKNGVLKTCQGLLHECSQARGKHQRRPVGLHQELRRDGRIVTNDPRSEPAARTAGREAWAADLLTTVVSDKWAHGWL